MRRHIAASVAASLAFAAASPPAFAQALRPDPGAARTRPAPQTNGIRSATPQPDQPSTGTQSSLPPVPQPPPGPSVPLTSGAPAAAPSGALIVPVPEGLSWDDVLSLKDMHFSVLPRGRSNVLFAYGPVDDSASVRFRAALDAARPIDEIWLYSQGGNLEEGLEIGRMIHARKLATHVVKGHQCVSACNFMFMGGVVRYIDSGAAFVVHMFSDGQAEVLRRDIVQPPKTLAALIRRFPTVNLDIIIDTMSDIFPQLEVTVPKFRAAMNTVKQSDQVDTDDRTSVNLAALRVIIADYNRDHPDTPVDERAIIMRVVLREDVKSVQMDAAQTSASIARYLTEMGLSLKFLTRFAELHNDKPTALTRAELREFNVMNTD